jgi:hypothetical protein
MFMVVSLSFEKESANERDTSDIDVQDALLGSRVEYPAQNLFLWAILYNRIETAKIFWRIGQVEL